MAFVYKEFLPPEVDDTSLIPWHVNLKSQIQIMQGNVMTFFYFSIGTLSVLLQLSMYM